MSTQNLEQGSQAWLDARVGLVTGSMVGAVLNCSPFMSRKRALRVMVEESMGRATRFTSEAMSWGTDHEAEACRLYQALYAGSETITETGFWVKGDLGASPDRLVGDEGLVEVKCPYAIRDDIAPVFKKLDDVPHYWHQMQMQMYCTGRKWCDFLQWTPHDHSMVRVYADPNWLEDNSDAICSFMEEYAVLMSQVAEGGPAERLAISEGWESSVERYAAADQAFKKAQAALSDAREGLLALMKGSKLTFIDSDTAKVQQITKAGSVMWKAIAESEISKEVLDNKKSCPAYHGKGSTAWRIDLKGDMKC
ncbi:MAG TPA: YqaJ viral recombinase family protein [Dehalococcoidia bacterium]|nr:YqaJ viral recombinase family protein [Dehalococcoidia bacterium]